MQCASVLLTKTVFKKRVSLIKMSKTELNSITNKLIKMTKEHRKITINLTKITMKTKNIKSYFCQIKC